MTKLYLLLIPLVLTLVFQNAIAEQDWNNYWVKGKFYTADRELVFQVFKISYKITGGDVNSIDYYDKSANILVKIKSTSDGIFQINVPRNLPMTNIGREDAPFIVVGGSEAKYNEVKSDCYRTFSIPFQKDTSAIELIGAMNLGSDPVRSIEVPPDCIIKPSPKDQIENGVLPDEVLCADNLVLIKKLSKSTVVCVKPTTAEKLVQRGWGTTTLIEAQNTMKTIKVTNTDFTINYTITGGKILDAIADTEGGTVILSLMTINDGEITLIMPLIEGDSQCQSSDNDYFVLVNGQETRYNVTTADSYRTLTFKFQKGAEEAEIIKSAICRGMPSSESVFVK